jgi:hypothetical protein
MAHSFKNYSAKPTFGSNKESNSAGDYILRKKARATFCTSAACPKIYNLNTQGDLNLLKTAKYLDNVNCRLPFNKNNLNINLVTKLDLTDVCVIEDASGNVCPTSIIYDEIPNFYNRYIIDPSGNLFGNTQCGISNFLNYLVYNPHYNNSDPGHINNI